VSIWITLKSSSSGGSSSSTDTQGTVNSTNTSNKALIALHQKYVHNIQFPLKKTTKYVMWIKPGKHDGILNTIHPDKSSWLKLLQKNKLWDTRWLKINVIWDVPPNYLVERYEVCGGTVEQQAVGENNQLHTYGQMSRTNSSWSIPVALFLCDNPAWWWK